MRQCRNWFPNSNLNLCSFLHYFFSILFSTNDKSSNEITSPKNSTHWKKTISCNCLTIEITVYAFQMCKKSHYYYWTNNKYGVHYSKRPINFQSLLDFSFFSACDSFFSFNFEGLFANLTTYLICWLFHF